MIELPPGMPQSAIVWANYDSLIEKYLRENAEVKSPGKKTVMERFRSPTRSGALGNYDAGYATRRTLAASILGSPPTNLSIVSTSADSMGGDGSSKNNKNKLRKITSLQVRRQMQARLILYFIYAKYVKTYTNLEINISSRLRTRYASLMDNLDTWMSDDYGISRFNLVQLINLYEDAKQSQFRLLQTRFARFKTLDEIFGPIDTYFNEKYKVFEEKKRMKEKQAKEKEEAQASAQQDPELQRLGSADGGGRESRVSSGTYPTTPKSPTAMMYMEDDGGQNANKFVKRVVSDSDTDGDEMLFTKSPKRFFMD